MDYDVFEEAYRKAHDLESRTRGTTGSDRQMIESLMITLSLRNIIYGTTILKFAEALGATDVATATKSYLERHAPRVYAGILADEALRRRIAENSLPSPQTLTRKAQ